MAEDYNFPFPARVLEDNHIKLIPFDASIHAQTAHELTSTDPQAYAHTANGPYPSLEDFMGFLQILSADEYAFTYAIIDKSKPPSPESPDGELAGMICYTEANDEDRSIEVSHIRVFKAYRGAGIATAAARLLLQHAFDPPEKGGLGLLRVEWHASSTNAASLQVQRKLGFGLIGVVRYERVFKDGKRKGKVGNGRPAPPGSGPDDLFRDLEMYAMYWDAWVERNE
ncbi:hypothetical protein OQA88_7393 [Cercophora sp. LCS_1]